MPVEFERDQNADLAEALDHGIVHVAADHAFADRKLAGAAERHVLADLGNRLGNRFRHRQRADLGGLDLVEIGAGAQGNVGDHLDQALEQIVAGDEVGLRVQLDQDALGALDGEPDQALGRHPARFLVGLGETLLAQQIDRLLHVAGCITQRRLAVHHAGAGALAQLFDHGCGNIGHL